ncbi:MAG TPA: putative inorganic carbon transporter subunit DabA, partial [Planctomycetaceae bacterium]|nr:putative inorganic carbon transporter subunit DabA [Planctomycetaceae bacterium]
IRVSDLDAVLLADLGDESDRLVGNFGTRYALRMAMLQFPLRTGSTDEMRWVVAETEALRKFRAEVEPSVRAQMITHTRSWVLQDARGAESSHLVQTQNLLKDEFAHLDRSSMEHWNERGWEIFVLNYLWRVCCRGVRQAGHSPQLHSPETSSCRHRDILLDASGKDSDLLVHEHLIRFCSAFLDQGFADWRLPDREAGFFESFSRLYGSAISIPTSWLADVRREILRLKAAKTTPLESIEESLALLGVTDEERESFILQSLLALRGWAGMIWQMETNAEWALHPASSGSLVEFLAVRLLLDRVVLRHVAREALGFTESLDRLRNWCSRSDDESRSDGHDRIAFTIFQLAQIRGWN